MHALFLTDKLMIFGARYTDGLTILDAQISFKHIFAANAAFIFIERTLDR